MESKICTYTAKNVRLQMIRVVDERGFSWIDLRFNRSFIFRYSADRAIDAAHRFSHLVSRLCIDRDTSFMLKTT